jgi:hypothetical protein
LRYIRAVWVFAVDADDYLVRLTDVVINVNLFPDRNRTADKAVQQGPARIPQSRLVGGDSADHPADIRRGRRDLERPLDAGFHRLPVPADARGSVTLHRLEAQKGCSVDTHGGAELALAFAQDVCHEVFPLRV